MLLLERDVHEHQLNSSLCLILLFAAAHEDRLRRKSGDDVGLFGSPGRHKALGSAHIFEAFRPRSKSDAQRAIKKPNIMSTVKNAVQVSFTNL